MMNIQLLERTRHGFPGTFDSMVHEPKEIAYFKKALFGAVPYDSTHPEIRIWEEFLNEWVKGDINDKTTEWMKLMYLELRDLFPYSGVLWRGMKIKRSDELYSMELASYSDSAEVAAFFAGLTDLDVFQEEEGVEYDNILMEIEVEDAFALDDLLQLITGFTNNEDLYCTIDDKGSENEKIYPLTDYLLDGWR